MKLSRASSYALVALAYLAREKPDAPIPSHEVARERDFPERFLLKILKPLVDAGVLRSVKGPNGGYRLVKPANEVTLLEVIEAVDGPLRGGTPGVGKGGADALDRRLQALCDEVLGWCASDWHG